MTEVTDRRSGIVHAAFRLVATAGFEGLRLQQIARDAGIDHSTLYHHFPGKKDIVAAVAEHVIGRFARRRSRSGRAA
jgi:TetR/AcrR family transcriptional repressor of nem operon